MQIENAVAKGVPIADCLVLRGGRIRSIRRRIAWYAIKHETSAKINDIDETISTLPVSLPSTFRRLVARRTGTSFAEVAEVEEVPMLIPGEGEVLIKVIYAGVNGGCETFRARGEHAFVKNRTMPWFALGAEGAGTVQSVGTGVTNLRIGQSVTFIGGAFSEFVVVKAVLCWPIAKPTPEAVALTISATVAAAALTHVARTNSYETVLITAAGGATGHFAAQLAQHERCRVVATCGGEKKAERLRALGLHRVIDHTREVCKDIFF